MKNNVKTLLKYKNENIHSQKVYLINNAHTKKYEINAHFDDIKKSFVFSNKNDVSKYDNSILATNNDFNNDKFNIKNINNFKNLRLHDYSRIFLNGKSIVSSKLINEITSNNYSTILPHDKNEFSLDVCLSVTTFESNHPHANHTGWYNFIENNNTVSLSGTLFYNVVSFPDLLEYFKKPLNIFLLLTKMEKRHLSIQNYPWNRFAKTFYENKNIFLINNNKSKHTN